MIVDVAGEDRITGGDYSREFSGVTRVEKVGGVLELETRHGSEVRLCGVRDPTVVLHFQDASGDSDQVASRTVIGP